MNVRKMNSSAQGSDSRPRRLEQIIEQQAAAIEELTVTVVEQGQVIEGLRRDLDLIARLGVGPLMQRVNGLVDQHARIERALKPRLVVSN